MWREVHALLSRSYRHEADLIGYDALPPLLDDVHDLVVSGETFVAAVRDGRAVGCISWKAAGGAVQICRLGVDRAARRSGVARTLVREALTAAGGRRVSVQTATANAPALALYAAAGFVEQRRWRLPDGLELVELVRGRVE